MKGLISTLIFCNVFGFASAQNLKADSLSNELIRKIVSETTGAFSKKKSTICILDHFLSWNPYSFEYPREELPRNDTEREIMMNIEYEPYNNCYVFCYKITDSIFDDADRSFMVAQAKASDRKPFTYTNKKVVIIANGAKATHPTYAYTPPVFSKNFQYAIIRIYEYGKGESLQEDLSMCHQTFYYKYTTKKRWKRIYQSPVILH